MQVVFAHVAALKTSYEETLSKTHQGKKEYNTTF
jgi:hypothetical protein